MRPKICVPRRRQPWSLPGALALALLPFLALRAQDAAPALRIGSFDIDRFESVCFVKNDRAAFVLTPDAVFKFGPSAPDDSYHLLQGNGIRWTWGKTGQSVVGKLEVTRPLTLTFALKSGWPGFSSQFTRQEDGFSGTARDGEETLIWQVKTSPPPASFGTNQFTLALKPGTPTYLAAGLGKLPGFASIDTTLSTARTVLDAQRPKASGPLGDFIGAISDVLNNSRMYSSDNRMLAVSVSRGWVRGPNANPYFGWDSLFNGLLASIDNPGLGRDTIRAILSCQTADGFIPNFGHWNFHGLPVSSDRSQPPVGALCVWKMHLLHPDAAFLREVYPNLKKWHAWWMVARNPGKDGLLCWGSSTGTMQGALWETGWDNTPHFSAAEMVGDTLNAYAVDLNSLWSMDAQYLALIADAIGRPDEAGTFRHEAEEMNRRINETLWNPELNLYCSRLWAEPEPLAVGTAFPNGFQAEFFKDRNLEAPVAARPDRSVDFNWHGQSPQSGVPAQEWSARWKGDFVPPGTGRYILTIAADDGVRLKVQGKPAIEDWSIHATKEKNCEISATKGVAIPIEVEYFQAEQGSEVHLTVARTSGSKPGRFLTRLTPMNFYPLICRAPTPERAARLISVMTDPKEFWGEWVLPTVSRKDPLFPEQGYWQGKIWGPVNYLVFQGLKNYASPGLQAAFAEKSIRLFMMDWKGKGVCGENYLSTTGAQSSDPHYTWGALLCLIGYEALVDVDEAGNLHPGAGVNQDVELQNMPWGGSPRRIIADKGAIQIK